MGWVLYVCVLISTTSGSSATDVLYLGPGIGTQGYSTYLSLPDLTRNPTNIQHYPIQEPYNGLGINGAVAAFIDEKIIICGGETPYSDPNGPVISKNCYTLTNWEDWTPAPSMRMERSMAAGTYTDRGWLVTGGTNDRGPQRSTEMLVNGHWVDGPELPTAMFGHCIFRLNSDQYLLTGGVTEFLFTGTRLSKPSPSYMLKNNVYDDVEGGPLVDGQACAMLGEDAYVVGGLSALTNEATSEVHIWSEGEWKEGPELPVPVFMSSLVAYQDHLYLLGGQTGNPNDPEYPGWGYNQVIYKLDQGAWTAVEDAGTTRASFPALIVPQK